jgi:hypothetical protein
LSFEDRFHAEFNMAKDRNIGRDNAKKFREYAAECGRMARTVSEADRAVLMQIAQAWIACAEEVEKAGAYLD